MANKRKRLVKALDHFESVERLVHTKEFHDIEWLQGQVKAAIRLAKTVRTVINIYEEDMTDIIESAVRRAIVNAND